MNEGKHWCKVKLSIFVVTFMLRRSLLSEFEGHSSSVNVLSSCEPVNHSSVSGVTAWRCHCLRAPGTELPHGREKSSSLPCETPASCPLTRPLLCWCRCWEEEGGWGQRESQEQEGQNMNTRWEEQTRNNIKIKESKRHSEEKASSQRERWENQQHSSIWVFSTHVEPGVDWLSLAPNLETGGNTWPAKS